MIQPRFSRNEVRRRLQEHLLTVDRAIVSRMVYVGETFVRNARANGNYLDQTGNLRSSICYIVYKDGIKRSAGPIPQESKKLITELKSKYRTGYVLIVVAGMNYAASVESKGKNVLTSDGIQAENELKEAFKNFRRS